LQAVQVLDQQIGAGFEALAQRIDPLTVNRSDLTPFGLEARLAADRFGRNRHDASVAAKVSLPWLVEIFMTAAYQSGGTIICLFKHI
jgi:hypothetical protein